MRFEHDAAEKKIEDLFEVLRGKSARTQASLMSLTMLTSKLPSGYGRDLQESRSTLFEAKNTVSDALFILLRTRTRATFRSIVRAASPRSTRTTCKRPISQEAMVLRHKVPFRTAYRVRRVRW